MSVLLKTLLTLFMAGCLVFFPRHTNAETTCELPIFSVETPEKVVSLTFNAAWAAGDTEKILDILAENDIKASFFLCGIWVRNNPEILKRIHAEGHDVCSHGDSHAHVSTLSFEGNQKEVTGVHNKVKDIIGIDMNLYRPAYGEYNTTVVSAAESLGYKTIQWDVDSLDWRNQGAEHEVKRVLDHKNLRNGSIILFHTDAKYTAEALGDIIQGLRDKGYGFTPLSDLIYRENYDLNHEGRQIPKEPIKDAPENDTGFDNGLSCNIIY